MLDTDAQTSPKSSPEADAGAKQSAGYLSFARTGRFASVIFRWL
jgi:hypothetical protein